MVASIGTRPASCICFRRWNAAVGEWEKALAAFLTAPGEVAKVADRELNKGNTYTAAKTAKFWWDYADGKPKAKMEAVRLHTAMWYELALGENAYSGNELKPIVLPLKGKTVIEFIGVPAGEFTMGTDNPIGEPSVVKPHHVKITRPFWLSKYKVTKEVWNTFRNVELSDYDKAVEGMKVPQAMSFDDAMAFCDRLTKCFRAKLPSHYVVRTPTEEVRGYDTRQKAT